MKKRPRIIFIVGPTAIGKTQTAIKLARKIKGEIISADSMQVYKGMNILSQAPSLKEQRSARHYLVGALNSQKEYSAAIFMKKARGIIESIIKRGKAPIIAGGSGLYVKALVDGLFPSPEADLEFRKKLSVLAKRYGNRYLHKRLLKLDPASAANIHPNNLRRIIRALELYHSTGKTMSELKKETKGLKDIYDIKIFGVTAPRETIYKRINARVDKMFAEGAVREVRRLMKKDLSKTARAALGFKEISGYIKGEYSLEAARELLKMNTRRFAKRQLTWFKTDKRIRWNAL